MSNSAALILLAVLVAGILVDKYLLNRGVDLGRVARWVVPIGLLGAAAAFVWRGYRPGVLELALALIAGLIALAVWVDLKAIKRGYDLLRRLKYLAVLLLGFGLAILGIVTQTTALSDARALAKSGRSVDAVVEASRMETSFSRRRGQRTRHMHSVRHENHVWTLELHRPYAVGETIPVVFAESKSSAVVVGGYRDGVWKYLTGDRTLLNNLVTFALPLLGLSGGIFAVRRLLLDERSLDAVEKA